MEPRSQRDRVLLQRRGPMGLGGQKAGDVAADKYRLVRRLGSGGMGAVWHATHVVTRRPVALKFLHANRHTDINARARLLREARAAAAVGHPAVVTIHDVIEVGGAPVLVMDLLEGESLRECLEREGRLAPGVAVDIALAILSVLSAAHAHGIVHRDLKPENVFLPQGGPSEARLLDFGIAKITRTDGLQGLSTETGAMLGTPHYMAPEQAFGEKDVDGRADLWALGVLLYECLSARRPIDGENLGQILRAMTECKVKPLLEVAPDVPVELAEIVGALLVERGARPADADTVSQQLTNLAPGLSKQLPAQQKPAVGATEATTGEPVTRTAPRARRRLSRVGSFAAVGAAVVLGALSWLILAGDSEVATLHAGLGTPVFPGVDRPAPPPDPRAVASPGSERPPAPVIRRAPKAKPPPSAEPEPPRTGSDKLINEPPF